MKTLLLVFLTLFSFLCSFCLQVFFPDSLSKIGKSRIGTSPFRKIFDVHLHGSRDPEAQLKSLQNAGVYRVAMSSSWDQQLLYRAIDGPEEIFGLMFPCPVGKVPYSLQKCFDDGKDWPDLRWLETQIRAGRVDFLGEVLAQYYGIASSDSLLFPYYAIAEKYGLPVGLHTGGAGPDHGSPNFQMTLGNPVYARKLLQSFPTLKLWLMHSGDQFYREAIEIMLEFPNVYADISVIANPEIVPTDRFVAIMQAMISAGLEDRLMFGTDNGDIIKMVVRVEKLSILSEMQKQKVFYLNAEKLFQKK